MLICMAVTNPMPTSVWLDQKTREALDKLALEQERSRSQVVRRAITAYVKHATKET